ncbi:MAG: hypothetical protein MUC88_02770 [Planctomycetes bacterium]|jgi:hypothetical protein|nr:hypothetical protein [Planctomycetota bacterium]
MDEERMDELARDPRFISGIYNYCDRWCERCAFTARCLNYAMGQEVEAEISRARDSESEAFRDNLHETFENARDEVEDQAEETDFDLEEEELQESVRAQAEIDEAAEAQPCSRTAMRYIEVVDQWLQANAGLFDEEGNVREPPAGAGTPGTGPAGGTTSLRDCLEVIGRYQRQIYIKLCRAATGMIRGVLEGNEYDRQDANGSAKVALLGIERSLAAWAIVQRRFPDHEDIVFALGTLKRLLRQVEAAFPGARSSRRPGFDPDET